MRNPLSTKNKSISQKPITEIKSLNAGKNGILERPCAYNTIRIPTPRIISNPYTRLDKSVSIVNSCFILDNIGIKIQFWIQLTTMYGKYLSCQQQYYKQKNTASIPAINYICVGALTPQQHSFCSKFNAIPYNYEKNIPLLSGK